MRNNNFKVIRRLSNRNLRKNRMRNIFALSAIIITAVLFTTLFTLGFGLIQITQEQNMRQVGTRAHAGLKDVTKDQYDKITAHPLVKEHSYNIFIGNAKNKELVKRQTEIRYTEEQDLKYGFAVLEEGKLPVNENEAVVDTIVMDLMGIPHKVGEEIELKFNFMGEEITKRFTICGWYQGDPIAKASTVYLSRVYYDQISEPYTEDDFLKVTDETSGVGLIQGSIVFRNSFDIEEKMAKVIIESGYSVEDIDIGINWAYFTEVSGEADFISTVFLITVFLVILLTGYLIIYNIFQISIINDIRNYGLLKTIGATKKQIRRLVLRQAFLLSAMGIPIGLGLGYLIGNLFIPILFGNFTNMNIQNFHMKPNFYIFLFGGLFSLITIYISCRKPGKIAGNVSPIEAVKYTEGGNFRRKRKKSRHGVSLCNMAFSNLSRNRKKTLITISSLSLSVVLMIEVVTFSRSFSIDKFMEGMLTGDFMISSIALNNYHTNVNDMKLPEEYIKAIESLDGIETSGRLYTTSDRRNHTLSDTALNRFREFYEKGELKTYEEEYYRFMIEKTINEKLPITEQRYAFDETLLHKLKVLEGKLDIDKFRSGNYILVVPYPDMSGSYYKPGDKVMLNYHTSESVLEDVLYNNIIVDHVWRNDQTKEYEVMAVVDIPYSMTERRYYINSLITILPIDEFLKNDNDAECFAKAYWVEDEKEPAFEKFLKNYSTKVNPNVDYESKEGIRAELSSMNNTINFIGGALSLIVGVVGILNFINTMITSVITRKREFAMLQSIGLTNQQLRRMLIYEGLSYLVLTALISLIIGSLLSVSLIRALNSMIVYFDYQFTLQPFVLLLPFFLIIGISVPMVAYRNSMKLSIVERLREAE